jgi:hypothetical protein
MHTTRNFCTDYTISRSSKYAEQKLPFAPTGYFHVLRISLVATKYQYDKVGSSRSWCRFLRAPTSPAWRKLNKGLPRRCHSASEKDPRPACQFTETTHFSKSAAQTKTSSVCARQWVTPKNLRSGQRNDRTLPLVLVVAAAVLVSVSPASALGGCARASASA